MPKFAGFTPEQEFSLLTSMGYKGPMDKDEMDKFLQSSPSASAKMGKFTQKAESMLTQNYAAGGLVPINSASNSDLLKKNSDQKAVIASQDPARLTSRAKVDTVDLNQSQLIDQNVGKQEQPDKVNFDPTKTDTVVQPDKIKASSYDATKTQDNVEEVLDNTQAATAEPTKKATVQGQLEELYKDFEDGTPPWASGAMRAATATMQKRGLGASSLAGQAVVQAAMEAALPIAAADAKTQAQFEMQNLSNEQQTTIFKTQQKIASLFNDQAQENAAKQFNSASENQINTFFADLEQRAAQFNVAQINGMRQFNTSQETAVKQFNAQIDAQRDQFNATNSLVIAQANAKWRQQIETANASFQNAANMEQAKAANSLTSQALDYIWQRERDIMAFTFQSSENQKDRDTRLLLGNKQIDAQRDSSKSEALGYLAANIVGSIF